MDSADDVAELRQGLIRLVLGEVQELVGSGGVVFVRAFRQGQAHGEGDQAGLGAVLQVLFYAAQFGFVGGYHSRPRRDQFLAPLAQTCPGRGLYEGGGPPGLKVRQEGDQGRTRAARFRSP